MNIEVIKSQNSMQEVWKLSRPYLFKEDIPSDEELMRMNLPINQFNRVTLHITSSILFRDLVFTFRPINVWARSNRTIKFTNKNLRPAYDEITTIAGYLNADYESIKVGIEQELSDLIDGINRGLKQDYQKTKLPVMIETEFCIDIDYRSLFNMLYTFECHCYPLFTLFLDELVRNKVVTFDMYNNAIKVDLFNKIALTENDNKLKFGYVKFGDMTVIKTKIKMNLMAQFIRQHSTTIKNQLWNLVDTSLSSIVGTNCSDHVIQVAYILNSQLNNLLSTRTCWFAQFDKEDTSSWSHILKDLVKDMSEFEFISQLPCGGVCTNCRIEGDMIPRIKHTEVNPPCPILIENPYIIDQRIKEYKSDSTIMNLWNKCKKLIKFNPKNKHNLTYSELDMESGTNVYMENK